MKKQRNVLISYILFYGGFFIAISSIVGILVYTLIFNNYKGDFIHLLFLIGILIGITCPLFASNFNLYFYFVKYNPNYQMIRALRVDKGTGFIQGVPNNNFSDFSNIDFQDKEEIVFDYKKGIYECNLEQNKITIDMNGWFFKDKYIYELLHTYLRVKYINNKKMPAKYIYKKITNDDINKLILVINKGRKTKKYTLSFDNMIKSNIFLSIKNHKKQRFSLNGKLKITDLYDLVE